MVLPPIGLFFFMLFIIIIFIIIILLRNWDHTPLAVSAWLVESLIKCFSQQGSEVGVVTPVIGWPLMLQVMAGVGIPSAWHSSLTVSPGEYIKFWGSFTQ